MKVSRGLALAALLGLTACGANVDRAARDAEVRPAAVGEREAAPISDADRRAIEEVLEQNYVDALFRKRDPDLMREGFADTFVMQVFWDRELTSRSRDAWLEKMNLDKVPTGADVRGEVTVLDVTGVAAVARLEFYRGSELTFTDYFGLYRTDDGWKVVNKHFHKHGYEGHEQVGP